MIRSLRTKLPALALSAAVALGAVGATTAPARADADDAARIIGGIIALYAIGRAIENSQQRHVPSQQYHHVPSYGPVAPARCYREFHTHEGLFRGYAQNCLLQNVNHGLPDACARQYHTNHGPRVFYGARCMVSYGWVQGH